MIDFFISSLYIKRIQNFSYGFEKVKNTPYLINNIYS